MTNSDLYQNKRWLHEQYIKKKRSTTDIAKELGVGHKTISRWLHRFDIPVRTVAEAHDIRFNRIDKPMQEKIAEYYAKSQELTIQKRKPQIKLTKRG